MTCSLKWNKVAKILPKFFLTLLVASFGSLGKPSTEVESIERKTFNCSKSQSSEIEHSIDSQVLQRIWCKQTTGIQITWTCQASGSFSFGQEASAIPMMSEILSSLSKASSYDDAFSFWSPRGLEAFNQRSSKLVRISYAAGPSILQCISCQGSRGHPVVGPYSGNKINSLKLKKE